MLSKQSIEFACRKQSIEFRRRGKALSAFSKLYKLKVPRSGVVTWGHYKRHNDNGVTREKWVETVVPWNDFLDKFCKFCVKMQAYFHVYSHFSEVTKLVSKKRNAKPVVKKKKRVYCYLLDPL